MTRHFIIHHFSKRRIEHRQGIQDISRRNSLQFISGEGGVKGALYGDWHQLWIQIIATVISIVFSAVMTYILFKITDRLVGIRVDKRVEEEGLDIYEHGESAYSH